MNEFFDYSQVFTLLLFNFARLRKKQLQNDINGSICLKLKWILIFFARLVKFCLKYNFRERLYGVLLNLT